MISANSIEKAWRVVGTATSEEIRALQADIGRSQPDLMGFVLAFLHDLPPEALGLGLWVTLVAFQVFRASYGNVRQANERAILRQWHAAQETLRTLQEAQFTPRTLFADDLATTEPHVMQYVLDALNEDPENEGVALSDSEFWHLLAVLKTVVETLHEHAGAARRPGQNDG